MLNVKVKIRENLLPDIGTLYPNVGVQIAEIKLTEKEDSYYMVIWYNNRHALLLSLEIKEEIKGGTSATIKYYDDNNQEFTPKWKNKSKTPGKPQHFNPRLHSYLNSGK